MTTDTLRPAHGVRSASSSGGRRRGPRLGRLRPGAGRQHHAGPATYVLLAVAAVVSLFPLYWTLVAASQDNTRVTQTPPPFLPGPHLFENLGKAWRDAALGK
ncbi:carbohydrate ABC transporter permease, partial [Streptomyces sp. SID5785]|nr:carbohydrate ABC transporter permease [Streptomyces sp. SID5785]